MGCLLRISAHPSHHNGSKGVANEMGLTTASCGRIRPCMSQIFQGTLGSGRKCGPSSAACHANTRPSLQRKEHPRKLRTLRTPRTLNADSTQTQHIEHSELFQENEFLSPCPTRDLPAVVHAIKVCLQERRRYPHAMLYESRWHLGTCVIICHSLP